MEPAIPDDELAVREEALAWIVSRLERAISGLRGRQFDAFRAFVDLWLDAFDWRSPLDVQRYLQIPHSQRIERIERFRRQAESWDVTLEFPVGVESPSTAPTTDHASWRREYERVKRRRKTEADAAGWETVRETIEAEQRLRAMPQGLRECFEMLGLGPRATLADARRRYRDLAKRHHPDRSGSTRQMMLVNEAWQQVEAFFSPRPPSTR